MNPELGALYHGFLGFSGRGRGGGGVDPLAAPRSAMRNPITNQKIEMPMMYSALIS